MKKVILISLSIFMFTLNGCVSIALTDAGKSVQYVTHQEADQKYYKYIGEVSVHGIQKGLVMININNVDDLIIEMRNKTATMGGDYLVVDTISQYNSTFKGTGRAYKKK